MLGIVSHLNIKENLCSHRGHGSCLCRIRGLQVFESRWLRRWFFEACLWSWQNLSKLSQRDLENYQSVAEIHRFSASFSFCWGSDCTVTYNRLVSTISSPPECITRHPAVRHFFQRLNWFEFHTASGLNIQILNTYLRYWDISRCQNSLSPQHLLVNQKHCNLLWLELVNALFQSVWHTPLHSFNLFRSTNWAHRACLCVGVGETSKVVKHHREVTERALTSHCRHLHKDTVCRMIKILIRLNCSHWRVTCWKAEQ